MLTLAASFCSFTQSNASEKSTSNNDFSLELLQYLAEFSSADGEMIDPETMQPVLSDANCPKTKLASQTTQVKKKPQPETAASQQPGVSSEVPGDPCKPQLENSVSPVKKANPAKEDKLKNTPVNKTNLDLGMETSNDSDAVNLI